MEEKIEGRWRRDGKENEGEEIGRWSKEEK